MRNPMTIGVAGAGSIGAYLGARLAAAGHRVRLLGRQRLADAVAEQGLRVSSLEGFDQTLAADALDVVTNAAELAGCDLILVTTKSHDTEAMACSLAPHLNKGATVVSFQNGVRNPAVLRERLPDQHVLAGMVPYNVIWADAAHFHQGTSGSLVVETGEPLDHIARAVGEAFKQADLPVVLEEDIDAVQWGKLVVNLNNATNALSGIPLQAQLADRDYRRATAAAQREALALITAAGFAVKRSGKMLPTLMPKILVAPDWLFRRVAAGMVKVDPQARSSMWEDLTKGRKTEIDYLNGEIVRLAESIGRQAPINAAVCQLIHAAEQAQASPELGSQALLEQLGVRR
ncbi:MAG: 2-dehydropantoate 2-reductase [Pseudomonadota bacterium]|nr:2-dehydropantoate 2-reductase [Pseudomonadota bacterium]